MMEYGLHSPITSFVASSGFLNASESRLQAIPWSACVWKEMGEEGDKEVVHVYYLWYACVH